MHVCYNLEKDTTGVLLLARTEETAERIHNLIRSQQSEKRYMSVIVKLRNISSLRRARPRILDHILIEDEYYEQSASDSKLAE